MLLAAIILLPVLAEAGDWQEQRERHDAGDDVPGDPAPETKCGNFEYRTPTGECTKNCRLIFGYYADESTKTCMRCDTHCRTCEGAANSCTSCPSGKSVFTNETSQVDECGDECKEGVNGCAECNATILGAKYCSKCSNPNDAPYYGRCKSKDNSCKEGADGVCTTCAERLYLYQGGCYGTRALPGGLICKTATEDNKCEECTNELDPVDGRCDRSCHSTCATCSDVTENGCLTCKPGYYKKGEEKGKCMKCSENDTDGQTSDCTYCEYKDSKFTCLLRDPGQCIGKIPDCKKCAGATACQECGAGFYLTHDSQCTHNCSLAAGQYGDNDTHRCTQCNTRCKTCSGPSENQCTGCPDGKMLQYTSGQNYGTCVDGCKTSSNGTGCKVCGAFISSTAYCSQCSTQAEAPFNGVCKANTARTPWCSNISDGKCTQCANGYFLFEGGCYETAREPGKQVCSAAETGKCKTCANGLPATDGKCSTQCHETCATCSGTEASECMLCASGHYKEADGKGPCIPCSSGAPGCTACSYFRGVFTCLAANVNRSGLGAGAIAGIAVAAVLVVGGITGFLCWWFLVRGRAGPRPGLLSTARQ